MSQTEPRLGSVPLRACQDFAYGVFDFLWVPELPTKRAIKYGYFLPNSARGLFPPDVLSHLIGKGLRILPHCAIRGLLLGGSPAQVPEDLLQKRKMLAEVRVTTSRGQRVSEWFTLSLPYSLPVRKQIAAYQWGEKELVHMVYIALYKYRGDRWIQSVELDARNGRCGRRGLCRHSQPLRPRVFEEILATCAKVSEVGKESWPAGTRAVRPCRTTVPPRMDLAPDDFSQDVKPLRCSRIGLEPLFSVRGGNSCALFR